MTIPRTHLFAALLALALIGAACGLVGDQETLAEMTVTRISGTVTLVRDGTSRNVAGETDIEPGDQITTAAEGGRAELRLEGERRAELAPGSRIEVSSERGVTGLEGSVLAQPRSGDRLSVDFGEARALAGNGVFRVDLGLGTSRVGVYEGAASVSVPEQEPVTVNALWQADAAANARILSPSPLRISDQDPWDRIELGDVLD
ncbi:MAG: FecR domain-containing protein, partial [Actinomycetota bacterium]